VANSACALAAVEPLVPTPRTTAGATTGVDGAFTAETARIAGDPRVVRALRVVEELEPRTMEDLITLTEIPAPPFKEETRARHYLAMLREAGADSVFIDGIGNAVGIRRGTGTGDPLVLSGHLDTVFPEGTDVTVRMRGDTLFAPGVGDDTRGLVVVLTVLRALEAADIRTSSDIWFVGTVGEEGLGDLRGVKHLFRDGAAPIGSFISVDGGGSGRVVHEALGSRRYRVTFTGPGGHSWGAFGLANPAHAMGRAISLFDEAAAAFVSEGPRTSYNVGVVGGGTSVNSIPFEAWMEVDMRSIDAGRLTRLDSLFRSTVATATAEQNERRSRGPVVTAEPALVGDRPSGSIDPATPLVQRAMATITHFGSLPELTISSTDSNVPISLGIPAVTLSGGGVGGNAHSLDEWWMNVDGHLAIQSTLLLVLAEAGLPGVSR
jgi:acetylornithine deacetylase/succinyl-diaminopimelate desuccinylase-like protein